MNIITDSVRTDGEYKQLLKAIFDAKNANRPLPLAVTGLCEGATDACFAALLEDVKSFDKRTALIICPEEKECVRLKGFLSQFGFRVAFFMGRDLTFYNITASHEYEHERLRVLSGLLDGSYDAVVTTPDAALGYTIPSDRLIGGITVVDFDKSTVDTEEFSKRLVSLGYVRTELVDGAGQFAVRGGIIDVFPASARYHDMDNVLLTDRKPFRIELFGDEIDRMELFDPETQRMTVPLNRVEFSPARELLIDGEKRKELRSAIDAWINKSRDERAISEMRTELLATDSGTELNFLDKYITLIYPERACLLDYFSRQSTVFMKGISACAD